MKTIRAAICFAVLLAGSFIPAAEATKSMFAAGLEKLAKDASLRRNESPVQTFYNYAPKTDDENGHRYVYWPEARFLLRLPNDKDSEPTWENIVLVTRFIDLENGIVTRDEDIGSSTYLELESEIVGIVRKCLDGVKVTVLTGAIKRGPAVTSGKKN